MVKEAIDHSLDKGFRIPIGRGSTPAIDSGCRRQCCPKNAHFGSFSPANRALFARVHFERQPESAAIVPLPNCHAEILTWILSHFAENSPGEFHTGEFPPDNFPHGEFSPGEFPPWRIPLSLENSLYMKILPGKSPPRKIPSLKISPRKIPPCVELFIILSMSNEFKCTKYVFLVFCRLTQTSERKDLYRSERSSLGFYVSRFVTCSMSERSELRASILAPRYISSRRRAKRSDLALKRKFFSHIFSYFIHTHFCN